MCSLRFLMEVVFLVILVLCVVWFFYVFNTLHTRSCILNVVPGLLARICPIFVLSIPDLFKASTEHLNFLGLDRRGIPFGCH